MNATKTRHPWSVDLDCQYCGKSFFSNKADRRKYCTRACYGKAMQGGSKPWKAKNITKLCKNCGTEFGVGLKTSMVYHRIYCSHACTSEYHYRNVPLARQLSATDAAYLAGLTDGEGCILLAPSKGSIFLRLCITNTFARVIDWCASTTEIGKRATFNRGTKNKDQWIWTCSSLTAASVLRQLLPYLIIKKAQAELALEFIERREATPGRDVDKTWQHVYLAQMHVLNKRGTA